MGDDYSESCIRVFTALFAGWRRLQGRNAGGARRRFPISVGTTHRRSRLPRLFFSVVNLDQKYPPATGESAVPSDFHFVAGDGGGTGIAGTLGGPEWTGNRHQNRSSLITAA
jgi:hypothetical protein